MAGKRYRLSTIPSRLKAAPTRLQPASAAKAHKRAGGRLLYGRRWQKLRLSFLHRNPLCVHCEREGRVTAATEVDHVTPHRGDERLFWDESNWQALCRPCHSAKTVREDGGFGRPVQS